MSYYLKITFRKLFRDGIYSAINIGGLTIGMAAAMLIMLWIYNQWSYDRFHEKEPRLYQVMNYNESFGGMANTSRLLGPALKDQYPEIADMTRYNNLTEVCTYGDKKFNSNLLFADAQFLSMFTFPLTTGNASTALTDPHSVVLTRSLAERLFGSEDPLGKNILIRAKYPVTVTGIMDNPQHNSTFQFEALLPYQLMTELNDLGEDRWGNYETFTYVELMPKTDIVSLNNSIRDIIGKNTNNEDKTQTILHPLSKVHLYTKWENGQAVGGRIDILRLFFFIALLVLLIACINFINLSTARSAKRAKEVGVRKVTGARKSSLIGQFIGESMLITVIAAMIAMVLVILCLPFFNSLMNERIAIDFGNSWFWLFLVSFVIITGLLAGSYPAFYLSSFLPVEVLKGVFNLGKGAAMPRKALIVIQFSCAIVLITATVMVHKQIRYAQDRNSGYNKDQLILISLSKQMDEHQGVIRQELISSGAALSVTRTLSPITETWNSTWGIQWKGKDPNDKTQVNRYYVDAGWAATTGVVLLKGRDIDFNAYPTDSTALLLNESAVKLMNFEDPIGQIVVDRRREWHVVGVVKDFVIDSPYESIRPMIIGGPAGFFGCMYIKLNGANRMSDNIAKLEKIMAAYNSDFPFEYKFVDEDYARKFADEQRTGTLATCFAGLAIFISCLGLFGLSAYMAETRRKEIGVRKVLGASVINITMLISREFMFLVLVSIAIGFPVAWWLTNQWLSGYAYRTGFTWWIFVTVAVLAVVVALLTVGWQAVKAASANPVKSIKSE